MKKSLIFAALALVAFVGCQKMETSNSVAKKAEMSFVPMDGAVASRAYSTGTAFEDTEFATLRTSPVTKKREMQISAYLYPQNGEAGNYFVDKTYAYSGSGSIWWNVNTPGSTTHDPIYWPVGGTLDFLAYSVSNDGDFTENITWDDENAASQVVLGVPGENTQNDILFSSAYGIKAPSSATDVPMVFNHAQAWLTFELTGTVDEHNPETAYQEVVCVKRIELENIYNAGVLTINNNKGNATATWNFSAETKKNIEVDNVNDVARLNATAQFMDMLIPQQKKTAFVIYYTLGSDTQELSYRFTTDNKTWLMGEHYNYKINITTSEVTVAPSVTIWKAGDVADVNAQTSGDPDYKIF